LEASRQLKELAKAPFDLSIPDALDPTRVGHFVLEACGLKMLYATERVTDQVMTALYKLAEERNVIHEMERMQNGEVINCIQGYPSENRAVLHTAVRDFFDSPRSSKASVEATRLAKAECDKL
jgi:glucose-6-phosphate isomerase